MSYCVKLGDLYKSTNKIRPYTVRILRDVSTSFLDTMVQAATLEDGSINEYFIGRFIADKRSTYTYWFEPTEEEEEVI
jgi:hypothetical protein